MIRTHAIRAILIGSSGLTKIRFVNINPDAIEDISLVGFGFANIDATQYHDYSIVSLGFANIDPEAIDDPPLPYPPP